MVQTTIGRSVDRERHPASVFLKTNLSTLNCFFIQNHEPKGVNLMPPYYTTKHAQTYLHVYLRRHLTSMSQSGRVHFFSIPGGHYFEL